MRALISRSLNSSESNILTGFWPPDTLCFCQGITTWLSHIIIFRLRYILCRCFCPNFQFHMGSKLWEIACLSCNQPSWLQVLDRQSGISYNLYIHPQKKEAQAKLSSLILIRFRGHTEVQGLQGISWTQWNTGKTPSFASGNMYGNVLSGGLFSTTAFLLPLFRNFLWWSIQSFGNFWCR